MKLFGRNEWGGPAIFAQGSNNSRGLAIFYTKQFQKNIQNIYIGQDGRIIIIDIEEHGIIVSLAAIYAPNQDRPIFFKMLDQELRVRTEHKVIIGDFNLTLNVELDRNDTYHNNNKAKEEVENIMDQYCLRDIWRVQNPDKREFSWRKSGELCKASRIDFALVSGGIDQKVKAVQYLPGIQTDHRALYVCLDLDPFERGTGVLEV